MGSLLLHEIKRQASCFFKEKIKTARLVLTDVTPVELMTEEATNENPWPPDTRTMRVISRAAFEVDDYWRIVEILHKRLQKFDKRNWRVSFKALILLESLLTHGPQRIFEEFQSDKDVIKEITQFQYIDERGFNWGLSMRKLSERILKLLESEDFLKGERERARQLTRGIEGFGSFNQSASKIEGSSSEFTSKTYGRSNSSYNYNQNEGNEFMSLKETPKMAEGNRKEKQQVHKSMESEPLKQEKKPNFGDEYDIEDHPFVKEENLTTTSLLSMK
ncbi:hypothetical protein L6164_007829 [Bauhinia variegata]|uniref:Uncharacterized protein n=1 Tax=Bauhinia variegata TaxID=167791 RepID=A0ACB9PEY2_BAUVA|nr:hypothetical protein L6164_007829 [Bauhinia variegata]